MFWQRYFKLNVVQKDTLGDFLDKFKRAKMVFFDTETTGLNVRHEGKDYVVGYTFAFEDEISTDVFYVPVRHELEGKFENLGRFEVFKKDWMAKFPDFRPELFEGDWHNVDAYDFAKSLKEIFESGNKCYIAHNISYDLHLFANEGVDVIKGFDLNDFEDTQIMVHTIDETVEKNLESVTKRLFGLEKAHYAETIKTVVKAEKQLLGISTNSNAGFQHTQIPVGGQYSAEDVYFMKKMFPILVEALHKDEQYDNYKKFRIPYFKALWKMERRGIKIDLPALDKMTKDAEKELENLSYKLVEIIGVEFNPDSPQHLYEILFGHKKCVARLSDSAQELFDKLSEGKTTKEKNAIKKDLMFNKSNVVFETKCNESLVSRNLGFKPVETTDGGQFGYEELKTPKTGKDELKRLFAQNVEPKAKEFLKTLMAYKKMSKLISAFMIGLKEQVYSDGRVHCNFNICGTDSWRLSSSQPNLQQLPHPLERPKVEEGEEWEYFKFWDRFEIRKLFIADDNCTIVASDFHALEKFLTAHLSQDKVLIKMLKENLDPHGTVATIIFPELTDVNPNDVKKVAPNERQVAKKVGFALDYGGGAGTIARNLEIDVKTAQGYVDKYFEGFSGLHLYDKAVVKFAKSNGFVRTLGGHKRHLWDINNGDRAISSAQERVAINVMSQGSGADVAMFSQIDVDNDVILNSIGAYMVIQCHDEIVMVCPSEFTDLCKERLVYHMEHCLEKRGIHLTIPLEAVADVGHSYYEAK